MMGHQSKQGKLFYYNINLDGRVRSDHPLRKIQECIDFDFVYAEVKGSYGANGNISVPPPVILKMMLLLILYNVRSERELISTIPERLDWLWFLGYGLDEDIPNHSVLSKARARWGEELFELFFKRIVKQCVDSGLVDGKKLFLDSSLVKADASNNNVVNMNSLDRYLHKGYAELERRLEKQPKKSGVANKVHVSATDPDSSVVRQGGRSRFQYKVHRAVDGKTEIITATEVTAGEVNEAHRLSSLIDQHEETTAENVETVVADSKYGTVENYLSCHDRKINAHIPDLKETQKNRRLDIFPEDAFKYDAGSDTYTCPSGRTLTRRKHKKKRKAYEYSCTKKECQACSLYDQCTKSKTGRSIKRHYRHDELQSMREQAQTKAAKRDINTRQHLMERSFARATRYGYKRSRWRLLWRNRIQEYLTATVQNILVLASQGINNRKMAACQMMVEAVMPWKHQSCFWGKRQRFMLLNYQAARTL